MNKAVTCPLEPPTVAVPSANIPGINEGRLISLSVSTAYSGAS